MFFHVLLHVNGDYSYTRTVSPRDAEPDELSTIGVASDARASASQLSLRIVQDSLVRAQPLPASGTLVVGRSRDCEVRVDDPSISRRHAILHVGSSMTVEDLGSANGTRLGDRRLAPGERAAIAPGDVVEVGSVMLIVQRGRGSASTERPPSYAREGAMRQIHRLVDRIAPGSISVLLLGETGVGKEVMAEAIHAKSPRASRPLIRINCAALSESLLASELFGHEKGAFTGADQMKPGLLEVASGGTVFLDEIGEVPLPLQAKLLRVLEERFVTRVGGVQPRPIDVRFVAASNRDLDDAVAHGRFRQDLLYRLNGFTIVIPPLRERLDEIPDLAATFLAEASRAAGRPRPAALSVNALAMLRAHPWPGNVRELKSAMERAVLLAHDDVILPEHIVLSSAQRSPISESKREAPAGADALHRELDRLEKERVLDALARAAGNQTQAAKLLGISRGTLLARLEDYGVPRPRKK